MNDIFVHENGKVVHDYTKHKPVIKLQVWDSQRLSDLIIFQNIIISHYWSVLFQIFVIWILFLFSFHTK